MSTKKTKTDAYEVITNNIIEQLEKGTVPWHKPWNGAGNTPKSLATKKPYRGINVFILSMAGYMNPFWLTYRQAKALGGQVKKGEHGKQVVFWKLLRKVVEDEKTGERVKKTIPLLRYYTVFNVEQCDGLDLSKVPDLAPVEDFEHNPIEAAESIVSNMPGRPPIRHKENSAFYSPAGDYVNMPKPERFKHTAEYYSTLFHELTHSTGHTSRCNRPGVTNPTSFGSHQYSKEELCAEMGAAFLCGEAGIISDTFDNSAAYIKSWLSALKDDKKLVIHAAAQAQKAADYILDRKPEAGEPEGNDNGAGKAPAKKATKTAAVTRTAPALALGQTELF